MAYYTRLGFLEGDCLTWGFCLTRLPLDRDSCPDPDYAPTSSLTPAEPMIIIRPTRPGR